MRFLQEPTGSRSEEKSVRDVEPPFGRQNNNNKKCKNSHEIRGKAAALGESSTFPSCGGKNKRVASRLKKVTDAVFRPNEPARKRSGGSSSPVF